MKSKHVLFLPNDLGGGLGHVRRSARLAKILHNAGWKTSFITHKKITKNYLPSFSEIYYLSTILDKIQILACSKFKPIHSYPIYPQGMAPVFWEFDSFNYQPIRDGIFSESIVARRFKKLLRVLKSMKIDLIIGDSHLFSNLIARRLSLPLVQISRFAIFPENVNLLWWKSELPNLNYPNTKQMFSRLYQDVLKADINDISDLMTGDGYLLPGTNEIEPVQTASPHLFYGYDISEIKNIDQSDYNNGNKRILIMMGGGSTRSHLSEIYKDLCDLFCKTEYQVYFSDPFEVIPKFYDKNKYNNISYFKWRESSELFPNIDLIIHHGGYSTMLEAIWWGIPSIVIPSHSEQEGNGRRLERLNLGKVSLISQLPYSEIKFNWYKGNYTMFAGMEYQLKGEDLLSQVNDLCENSTGRQSLNYHQDKLKNKYSESGIINFLKNFI